VTVEAVRVLLEAMRVIIEAVRLFVEAVRMLVEAVRMLQSLANKSIPRLRKNFLRSRHVKFRVIVCFASIKFWTNLVRSASIVFRVFIIIPHIIIIMPLDSIIMPLHIIIMPLNSIIMPRNIIIMLLNIIFCKASQPCTTTLMALQALSWPLQTISQSL